MNAKTEDKVIKLTQLSFMIGTIIVFVAGAGWKLWAKDAIDQQIAEQLKPIASKVDSNSTKIKSIDYQTKQTLYLIKKLAGSKAVREMEEETSIFNPED